jgi:hypothetical protein
LIDSPELLTAFFAGTGQLTLVKSGKEAGVVSVRLKLSI